MAQPDIGDLAPDFTLPTDDGSPFTLSANLGQPVVLFFYPADDTPGCTTQNCAFSSLKPEFDALGISLVGISPDSVGDHAKFRAKYGLQTIMAADPEHIAISAYGVWGPKKFMGRDYEGLIRTTFLVDATGHIADKWQVFRTKPHAQIVLDRTRTLSP